MASSFGCTVIPGEFSDAMTSACLSSATMQSFLTGQLAPVDEAVVSEHLEQCPRCERLAARLSDDTEARALAATRTKADAPAAVDQELHDLCRRLHALGMFESVLDDADSGVAQESIATAINRNGSIHDTAKFRAVPLALSTDQPSSGPVLTQLGRYEIERTLGAGAFGIVYLATDARLHRKVAIKVARASVLAEPGLRIRFFREAEALARLEHPNIVPVFEADEIDGLCFLTLAYAEGPTLDQWLLERGGRLDSRLAAQLILPLVEAVEHAHTRGILHRDIKPGNVLLPRANDTAGQSGGGLAVVPKLTDFGLAKVVEERSDTTISGIVLGTAQYMAPEQAAGHLERIGPATDVYGLGAVLYQLLTGHVPIEGKSTIDTLRRLLIDEPVEVRALIPEVPDDLGAIVRKCLQKSPARRYESAGALAADLRQFLAGRPTKARPLSNAERCGRWLARHKSFAPLMALALAVVGLSVGLSIYAHRLDRSLSVLKVAIRERERANEAAETSQLLVAQQSYASDIIAAGEAATRGDSAQAVAALRRHLPRGDSHYDLRGLEWHYLWHLTYREPQVHRQTSEDVYQMRLSPDGREIAAVGRDGLIYLYDAAELTLRALLPTDQVEVNGVAYSRNGRWIATAGDDGTVRVFDLNLRQEIRRIAAHPGQKAFGVVFYGSDQRLASCGTEPEIRLWDAASGEPVGVLAGHRRDVEAIAVSPTADLLASASADSTAMLWDLATGQRVKTLEGHRGGLQSVAFSPDGRWLATGGLDNRALLWRVDGSKRFVAESRHLYDEVQSVAFSADGARLFVGDRRGAVHRFQVRWAEGEARPHLDIDPAQDSWQAHRERVWCVLPGRNADSFYTAGQDNLIHRWDRVPLARAQRSIPASDGNRPVDVAFSADGQRLFVLHEATGATVYNARTLQPQFTLSCRHGNWRSLAVLEGRDEVAAGNAQGVIAIWNFQTGALSRIVGAPAAGDTISELAYAPAQRLLGALPYEADEARIYDVATGSLVLPLVTHNHTAFALSRDGTRAAVNSLNNVNLFDVASQRPLASLPGHTATITSLAFHPFGKLLASGSSDRTVRLWSADGRPVRELGSHYADVTDVGFSPDGRSLVSVDQQGIARIVHVDLRLPLLDIDTQGQNLKGLAFSADSQRFAVIRSRRGIADVLVVGPPPDAELPASPARSH